MKKLKRLIAVCLAAITAMSAMSISAMATNEIDYSIYDSDMVYIQEHADKIAEYNAQRKQMRATTYSRWNWSNGIYSKTLGANGGYVIPYIFTPTSNRLYFNIEVSNVASVPYMTVNKVLSDGSLNYIGSYNITSAGNNNYVWSNYKRSLDAGADYQFAVFSNSRWGSLVIDISNTSL